MTATANLSLVPSLDEARRLARSYDVVPLYAEFIGDLETPISAVLRFAEEDTVFLLESAESAERFGRYSFLGCAVGYFSYDAVRYLEQLPDAPEDDLGVPEACFAVTDTLIVFDHLRHKVLVVSLVDAAGLRDVEGEGFSAAYRRAADDIR